MRNLVFHASRTMFAHTPEFRGKWRLRSGLARLAGVVGLPEQAIVRTADGIRLGLDTREFLEREIYLFGTWEHEIGQAMAALLRPGDVFIDAGANIGAHALQAARLVGPTGQVLAFEPNPGTRERLDANVALNGASQVRVLPLALSDRAGTAELFPDEARNAGAASLRPRPGSGAPVVVPTATLDSVLQEHGITGRVALVKIDVEG
ncbi:MAG: FkbM family methyltransferase, partial [Acetobacteraceae bacterium]|nr:FkbM family methyltransferase [Acetobacteraceae bacterium]